MPGSRHTHTVAGKAHHAKSDGRSPRRTERIARAGKRDAYAVISAARRFLKDLDIRAFQGEIASGIGRGHKAYLAAVLSGRRDDG